MTFTLHTPVNETSLIYLSIFTSNKQRVRYCTGERTITKFWDAKKQRVTTKGNPKGNGTNSVLDMLESAVTDAMNLCKAKKEPLTKERITFVLDATRNQTDPTPPESTPLSFWQYFDEFLSRDRFSKNGLPLKPQSMVAYQLTYKRLKEFEKSKRIKLDFDVLDKPTLEKFKSFLLQKQNNNFLDKTVKGLAPNTINLTFKRLKTVLNEAIEDGYNVPTNFKKVVMSAVPTTEISLSIGETMSMYHLDLKHNPTLDVVRDLFLIGCYTALRFSDYSKVNSSNIEYKGTTKILSITATKTGKALSVPITEIVEAILAKYDGTLPKPYTNQRMNIYLKEIGQLLELSETVKVTAHKQGLEYKKEVPKWSLLKTHTARRTGATILYNLTKNVYLCMGLTGHSTEKQFQTYIRNTGIDNAVSLDQTFKDTKFGTITPPPETVKLTIAAKNIIIEPLNVAKT
jgi:Phage integrase SAM-like domain